MALRFLVTASLYPFVAFRHPSSHPHVFQDSSMPLFSRIYLACFFLFYFGVAQGDSLQLLLQSICHRPMPHASWPMAILLTALLLFCARKMEGLCISRHHKVPSIPYIAAAWVAVMTVSIPFASVLRMAVLTLMALALVMAQYWMVRRLSCSTPNRPVNTWSSLLPHLLRLFILSLYMGAGAAATDVEHFEMQTAFRLQQGHPSKALQVGRKSLATSPRLFALRCLAMSTKTGQLPKHLLDQALPARCGSEMLLLPADDRQPLLLSPDTLANRMGHMHRIHNESAIHYFQRCARHMGPRPSIASDYYLCALLLDRKLDAFAQEVQWFYGPDLHASAHAKRLPHYFAEALVLYTRMRTQPRITYHDATIEANLHDYSAMGDSIPNATARQNLLRDSYGETYWWYYDYAQNL